jgi:hypothetical protein
MADLFRLQLFLATFAGWVSRHRGVSRSHTRSIGENDIFPVTGL